MALVKLLQPYRSSLSIRGLPLGYTMARRAWIQFIVAWQLCIAAWANDQSDPGKTVRGADGSIDARAKVATVLGRDILRREIDPPESWYEERAKYLAKNGHTKGFDSEESYRRAKMSQLISMPLIEEFGGKKEFEPTPDELREFTRSYRESRRSRAQKDEKRLAELKSEVEKLENQRQPSDGKAAGEIQTQLDKLRKEIQTMESLREANRKMDDEKQETFFVKWYVGNWKKQQWFYRHYGGRVIWQQVGPEALDGMRDFLKEQESKGRFAIYDSNLKALFWKYYSEDTSHTFLSNPDKIFAHPAALLDLPSEDEAKPNAK
jgi:hypothetical protein